MQYQNAVLMLEYVTNFQMSDPRTQETWAILGANCFQPIVVDMLSFCR